MTDRAALADDIWTCVLGAYQGRGLQHPWRREYVVPLIARVLAEHETEQDFYLKQLRAQQVEDFTRAEAAEARCAQLEQERDALKREAQCQAQEMRTQRAVVREIYQLCSGATGEPGDWHGAEPVRQLVA